MYVIESSFIKGCSNNSFCRIHKGLLNVWGIRSTRATISLVAEHFDNKPPQISSDNLSWVHNKLYRHKLGVVFYIYSSVAQRFKTI